MYSLFCGGWVWFLSHNIIIFRFFMFLHVAIMNSFLWLGNISLLDVNRSFDLNVLISKEIKLRVSEASDPCKIMLTGNVYTCAFLFVTSFLWRSIFFKRALKEQMFV